MSANMRFKIPLPEGYRIYFGEMDVAGVKHYINQWSKLVGKKGVEFYLLPDHRNKHDKNAIKVMGRRKGFLGTKIVQFGHLPKITAQRVTELRVINELAVRPKEIWIGDRGGQRILIDLIGPKDRYKDYFS